MLENTKYWLLIESLTRLNEDSMWDAVLDRFVLEKMARLNREQLERGETTDGIGLPDYSRASVEQYGKPAGPIKLFDTGAFWASIEPVAQDEVIAFFSAPIKVDVSGKKTNLIEKYGQILGLTEESLDEIRQEVKIKIIGYIRNALQRLG